MSEDEINQEGAAPEATELEKLRLEMEEEKKKNLYLRADFDNYRKQVIKERSDLMRYGSEPVIREVLSVLSNLERAAATEVNSDSLTQYKDGVGMIVTQLKKALGNFGVEEINPEGQAFNPNDHEALSQDNRPDLPAGQITHVLRKAYKLHGKLIQPAQVVVNQPQG